MGRLTEQQIVDAFTTLCKKQKIGPRKPEGLLAPYFVSEFNRLMEHRELNRMVNTDFDSLKEKGWYQNTVAARLNDMRKVDSGWHSTVFEMLVEVFAYPPTDLDQAYQQMTSEIKEFLVNSPPPERKIKIRSKPATITIFLKTPCAKKSFIKNL